MQFSLLSLLAVSDAAGSTGKMTVGTAVTGASCEYANEQDGGLNSPAATSRYISENRYCAVGSLYKSGAGCGDCFEVSYDGSSGTNPGTAGHAKVQVVNSAEATDFVCHKDVFKTITGGSTGIYPVTFKPISCSTKSATGVATVLDGDNKYYTKVIFSDLPYAVAAATLTVNSKSFEMSRVQGATFMASTDGSQGVVSFKMTLSDGSHKELKECFSSWPVKTLSSCAPSMAIETMVV
jgi:hypothetical protein